MFSLNLRFLIFNEKNGISLTIRKLNNIIVASKKYVFAINVPIKASFSDSNINGNDATKSPIAGVGSPMNDVVCLSSILNLARRNSANIAKKKAAKGTMLNPNTDTDADTDADCR